jgi:hypothetical protein
MPLILFIALPVLWVFGGISAWLRSSFFEQPIGPPRYPLWNAVRSTIEVIALVTFAIFFFLVGLMADGG